jgi:hypothetical protein
MMFEQWDRIVAYITGRQQGYRLTFDTNQPHVIKTLADLARFCRANASAPGDILTGRREVWLRIQEHLKLSPEKLAEIYGQPKPEGYENA